MTKIRHAGIMVGVQPGTRVFRIERNTPTCHRDGCHRGLIKIDNGPMRPWCGGMMFDTLCQFEQGSWCVWINPAPDFETGTYLKLYDNGRMERVTLYADGHEEVWLVKPED